MNYKKHLEEVLAQKELHHGNLINEIHKAGLFLKATSSLIGAGDGIELIHLDRRNDHEIELAVIIGKPARNVSAIDALNYVAGYCIGLDITIRGPEERSFRKSPDTYTVLGPWLVTADELKDPSRLAFTIAVNDEVRPRCQYGRPCPWRSRIDRIGLIFLHFASRRRDHDGNAAGRRPGAPR